MQKTFYVYILGYIFLRYFILIKKKLKPLKSYFTLYLYINIINSAKSRVTATQLCFYTLTCCRRYSSYYQVFGISCSKCRLLYPVYKTTSAQRPLTRFFCRFSAISHDLHKHHHHSMSQMSKKNPTIC